MVWVLSKGSSVHESPSDFNKILSEILRKNDKLFCAIIHTMKILIFGAGGIGSVFGAFFARMGHEVSLLGRPWHLDAIRKKGLLITGIWGDYRMKAFDLYDHADAIKKRKLPLDLIFLTVKSYDTEKAVDELVPLMNDKTTLVSFQNGLGNIETILKKVKPDQYLAGRVIFGVETQPGIAKVTVSADATVIGELPGVKSRISASSLAHIFNLCKIEAKAVPNILTYIWAKVIYNCALNGICTLHEIPYGKILETEATREEMKAVVRECYAVAEKVGAIHESPRLEPATADEYIDLLIRTLIPRTASHFPSMLQDLHKGKRTDIDALNGAIVRLGKETHVDTPANLRIVEAICKNKLQK